MADQSVYKRLAAHLSVLGMGMPDNEDLLSILKENLTPLEAEVALLLPTKVAPLEPVGVDEIAKNSRFTKSELTKILDGLTDRGLLFSGETDNHNKGYALQQVGFGFPQTFFWSGEETPHARKMAELVGKYFNRKVTRQAYADSGTKPYRYIPVKQAISQNIQAVYPFHMMEPIIAKAKVFAVAHCPCRVIMRLRGRACGHPEEVCLKFDDMARYVIDRGLAREITREEALEIIIKSEEAGLVHFVDNAVGDVKHNCNCCGCACWNVGSIKRRKIPRDVLMATYFIRETKQDECTGCGSCIEICPVDALAIKDDYITVDRDWCIGCGLCVPKCPTGAAKISLRTDMDKVPLSNFKELHEIILKEKGLK